MCIEAGALWKISNNCCKMKFSFEQSDAVLQERRPPVKFWWIKKQLPSYLMGSRAQV